MNRTALFCFVLLTACASQLAVPSHFPPLPSPAGNEPTAARIDLGRKLFHDARLSRTQEVSCATCHLQANAFADPKAVSTGVEGRTGTRNAPPLANLAWNTSFFWDGRAKTLEEQALGPITNPLEMDMTIPELVARVAADPEYARMSQSAYGRAPDQEVVAKALASFMRSLVSGTSRYDRHLGGDTTALTPAEKRGAAIALGERGECFHCHVGFNLTNNTFANNGMNTADRGREEVTKRADDLGKFKVPTLRNVGVTAPYMHDGSVATLREVVEHYANGGAGHPNTDPVIRPLELTEQERLDLVAFLEALTDAPFIGVKP